MSGSRYLTQTPPDAGPESARVSWWRRRSLRARLTAAAAVVMALGIIAASLVLTWRMHTALIAGLDSTIAQQANVVAAEAHQGTLPKPLPETDDGAPLVQVLSAQGELLAASQGMKSEYRALADLRHGEDATWTATLPSAGDSEGAAASFRVTRIDTDTPSGRVSVFAALTTASAEATTAELVSALAVGVPVIVLLLTAIGWLLLGLALRPVEQLRRQAAGIPGTDLHRRLAVPQSGDELHRLAITLNELLDRIEQSSLGQRQFIADAAHELRSPIAVLQTQLEVAARQPDPEYATEVIPALVGDAERLARLADDLLLLARLDSHPAARHRTVDLDDIVLREAQATRMLAPQLAVDTTAVESGRVSGDPVALGRVVRNLLDNAARFASHSITVALRSTDDVVHLEVSDDGPGIAPADRERVFERFTRLDDARSRDTGGAGLGLAIVREVIAGHGGRVAIVDAAQGACVALTLPAAS